MSARRALRALAAALPVLLALTAASAHAAPFGIANLDGQIAHADGAPYTQAGGHPDSISVEIAFNVAQTDPSDPADAFWPAEPVKDVIVDVPPGLVGNPQVVATCSLEQLAPPSGKLFCPSASQIGTATVTVGFCIAPGVCFPTNLVATPIFEMVTPPDVPARFGFNVAGTIVTIDASLRTASDYGLSVDVRNVSEALPIIGAALTLWGVPADPSHTPLRLCSGETPPPDGPSCAAGIPPAAFLRLPTACTAPGQGLPFTASVDSWQHPGAFASASFVTHGPPGLVPGQAFADDQLAAAPGPDPFPGTSARGAPQGLTGCDQLPFDPTLTARPATTASPGPSGWTFDLAIPQDRITDPTVPAAADLKRVAVTLPPGVRVSPSAADGLAACTAAQVDLHGLGDASCPDASKIGTVTIETPLLAEELSGGIYLATPFANPAGTLLAAYVVAKGPGVIVKLAGGIVSDPRTGQLSATFDDLPQLPFSHVRLRFFGGTRAPLSNPPRCGVHTTTATLTSWSGRIVPLESAFTTSRDGAGAPCPAPRFTPRFTAGTASASGGVPAGGAHSTFTLSLARGDEDEELAAIDAIDLPQGLLAKLAGVPLCPSERAAAGTCAESSRIGSVTAAAGPGPSPFAVGGRVYLGGAYKGAPFSLAIVVPVVAGPFDLGTVVVRSAIEVDRTTARIHAVTDPLPTILQGIPLQVRFVEVTIDRPNFIVNPTSCDPLAIAATARSTAGSVARVSSRFQVASCASLGLSPRMRLVVGAPRRTRAGVSTPLTATVRQPPGQAGLRAVGVTLPGSLNALLPVVEAACTVEQFHAGACAAAKVGVARAVTPLLDRPLSGSVYLVKNPAGGLPNLIVALRGQVDVDLVGTIKIPQSNRLGASFRSVPDVPIRRFVLKLFAGRHGAVGTVQDLCTRAARRQVAQIAFRGHNGTLVRVSQRLAVRGCAKR